MISPVWAHNYQKGDLEILHPVLAATPPGVTVAAGYLQIINAGESDDRLVGLSSRFASTAELYKVEMDADIARMRLLEDGLLLPAKSTVSIAPGKLHLMFMGLDRQLLLGESYEATLIFKHAGEQSVEFWVEDVVNHEHMDHGADG